MTPPSGAAAARQRRPEEAMEGGTMNGPVEKTVHPPAEEGTGWRDFAARNGTRFASPLIAVALIVVWELAVRHWQIPIYILPAPTKVFFAFVNGFSFQDFWGAERFYVHIVTTLAEAGIGFVIGVVAGIAIGGLIAQMPVLEKIIKPYVMGFQSLPKVAVAPLIVLWFGFGLESKVVLVALLVFFPLMVNSIAGFKSVDGDLLELMQSLSASRWQVFWTVQVPASLPYIFAGLEMGVVYSFLGAVVGEFVGGTQGLGVLVLQMNAAMDVSGMFAVLLILAGMGAASAKGLQILRSRVLYWAPSEQRATKKGGKTAD